MTTLGSLWHILLAAGCCERVLIQRFWPNQADVTLHFLLCDSPESTENGATARTSQLRVFDPLCSLQLTPLNLEHPMRSFFFLLCGTTYAKKNP